MYSGARGTLDHPRGMAVELVGNGTVELSVGEHRFMQEFLGWDGQRITTPMNLERCLYEGSSGLQSVDVGELAIAFVADMVREAHAMVAGGQA